MQPKPLQDKVMQPHKVKAQATAATTAPTTACNRMPSDAARKALAGIAREQVITFL